MASLNKNLNNFFNNNKFLGSFQSFKDIPYSDIKKECCFIGRSNVGKSSLINSLTKTKKLAKTSKTPGRTQAINVFLISEKINMIDCIFCKIINKEIPASVVYEDDDFLAFKDINPIDKVHILIIPKNHIESLIQCDEKNELMLGKMLLLGKKIAQDQGLKGYRTMINSGAEGGQEVFHIHFHIYGGSAKLAKI